MGLNVGNLSAKKSKIIVITITILFIIVKCINLLSDFIVNLSQLAYSECP